MYFPSRKHSLEGAQHNAIVWWQRFDEYDYLKNLADTEICNLHIVISSYQKIFKFDTFLHHILIQEKEISNKIEKNKYYMLKT